MTAAERMKADTNICYEECSIILALVAAGIGCVSERRTTSHDDER